MLYQDTIDKFAIVVLIVSDTISTTIGKGCCFFTAHLFLDLIQEGKTLHKLNSGGRDQLQPRCGSLCGLYQSIILLTCQAWQPLIDGLRRA